MMDKHATILVVDDAPDALLLLVNILEVVGYHILTATSGKEALHVLQQNSPDLILLDIMMPEMGGLEVCRRLKLQKSTKDIPVIFITALTKAEHKVEAFSVGGADYITKPFQHKEVLARIAAHLSTRQLQQQLERECSWFQTLSDAAFEGLVIHDGRQIVDVNQSIKALFGYQHDELIGEKVLRLIAPEFQESTLNNVLQGETKIPYLIKGVKRDGQTFLLEVQTREIFWQGRTLHVTAMWDVTLRKELEHENRTLRTTLKDRYKFGEMIGKSSAMQQVYEFLPRAAATDQNVAIYGESGTGKELAARMIHQLSERRNKPFVPVNCSAIPENLFESQFFGHCKGAFTGAAYDSPGYFEQAQKGTLFLDEVGELSPLMQAKLLRVLNDKRYTPIGASTHRIADVRIVVATNQDFREQMSLGSVRRDFFHRIHVLTIKLPPLRERKEDLPLLIEHFLDQLAGDLDRPSIPASIREQLHNYDWPGNVRELFNELTLYLTTGRLDLVGNALIEPSFGIKGLPFLQKGLPLSDAIESFEKFYIVQSLEKNSGKKGKAAGDLHVDRKTLYKKLKKHGVF
ncbi:MAG: response regulator [bacterium]|nr:response regulator [bacterium]